jgi:hypothetical protein
LLLVVVLRLRNGGGYGTEAKFRVSMDLPTTMVPLSFHAFFLVAGTISGIYFRVPALLVVSLLMAVIGVYLHRDVLQLKGAIRIFSSKEH